MKYQNMLNNSYVTKGLERRNKKKIYYRIERFFCILTTK